MPRSVVVTGGGRGVGRAIVERLLIDPDGFVVIVELDEDVIDWVATHSSSDRIGVVSGDAADPGIAELAADRAAESGDLSGWVNNAAVFRDAALHDSGPGVTLDLIVANLAPAVVGSAVAIRRFLAGGTRGSIVNVSSHQAMRPVRGALPYATAKAGIEGLTRAIAVDYSPMGIRSNAVALGSVMTDRLERFLDDQPDGGVSVTSQLGRLHPLGRVGAPAEVAEAVEFLLSERASLITGVVLPVDGGRSALGLDPEER